MNQEILRSTIAKVEPGELPGSPLPWTRSNQGGHSLIQGYRRESTEQIYDDRCLGTRAAAAKDR